ncbi:MAG TPA: ABC transporter permease [Gemmatimonadaceae bacterium]|nr:ABC transporter permease [Gemmatimonadaceae bacterium]
MTPLRYALRSLRRSPIFTVVAVLSLGLALAVNTTMFALIDSVQHPYIPYDARPVFRVSFVGGGRPWPTAIERLEAVRNGLHSADSVLSYKLAPRLVQAGNSYEDQYVAAVPPQLFDMVGVRPMYGRTLNAGDERRDAAPAAVISYTLWNRFFRGRRPGEPVSLIVGATNYHVVGVMPRGMHFPWNTDVWIPLALLPADSTIRAIGPMPLVRLKPGVTQQAAETELSVIAGQLSTTFARGKPIGGRLTALREVDRQRGFDGFSKYMLAVVAAVLLIACGNLGTMLLARGIARRREIAIRVALGASRRVIIGQVLTECGLVIGGGIVVGLVLTLWASYLLPHYATPYVPGIGDLQPVPSWRVFSFAVAAALFTLVLAGALPAKRAAATDPAEPMKEGAAVSTGRNRDRYNPLIVVEVALSTALLMNAGLFIILMTRFTRFDFSYAAKNLQTVAVDVGGKAIAADSAVGRFFDDLEVRSAHLPGARAATTTSSHLPDGRLVYAEGGAGGLHWINSKGYTVVSPTYFSAMGIPIVDGRGFEPGDRGIETAVVVVDEVAARELWPGIASPVGRMIKLGDIKSKQPWVRVVGVARATDLLPRKDKDLPTEPQIYALFGHDVSRTRNLIVLGDGTGGQAGQATLSLAIRREIESAAPWVRSPQVRRWLEGYESSRSTTTFIASLFTAFGVFGLALCAVGLYGVLAYVVSRRLRELAMRVALGARRRDLVRVVVHDATVTVLAGIGIGAFLALSVTKNLAEGMFTLRYELVIALVGAEAALFVTAIVACLGPLRQAIRADPAEVLRAS